MERSAQRDLNARQTPGKLTMPASEMRKHLCPEGGRALHCAGNSDNCGSMAMGPLHQGTRHNPFPGLGLRLEKDFIRSLFERVRCKYYRLHIISRFNKLKLWCLQFGLLPLTVSEVPLSKKKKVESGSESHAA